MQRDEGPTDEARLPDSPQDSSLRFSLLSRLGVLISFEQLRLIKEIFIIAETMSTLFVIYNWECCHSQ